MHSLQPAAGTGTRTGAGTGSGSGSSSGTSSGNGWKKARRRRSKQARSVGVMCAFKKEGILVVNYCPHVFCGHGFKFGSGYYAKHPRLVMPRFICAALPSVRDSEA